MPNGQRTYSLMQNENNLECTGMKYLATITNRI